MSSFHPAIEANTSAQLDYLSFTWAPQLVASYRRLAARSRTNLKKYLEEAKPLPEHDHVLFFVDSQEPLKADLTNPLDHAINKHFPLLARNKGKDLNIQEWSELTDDVTAMQSVQIDITRLDDLCYQELTHFLTSISRNLFDQDPDGSELTREAYEEYFTAIKRPMGLFGYKTSFDLWFNGHHIGMAACGAANGGCYISLSGTGCDLLDRQKTFDVLRLLPEIRITRLDIAVDFMKGEYSIDDFRDMYIEGEFTLGNRAPSYQIIEGGILQGKKLIPTKGRSFYVGDRKNGKLFRAYEKGRQMGDPDSKWVRGELEIRSKDREIPLFALLRPADYYAGAYPALEQVINSDEVVEVTRIETKKKTVKVTYSKLCDSAKIAYGALINVMREAKNLSDSEIVDLLIKIDEVPRSLKRATGVASFTAKESYVTNEQGQSLCHA